MSITRFSPRALLLATTCAFSILAFNGVEAATYTYTDGQTDPGDIVLTENGSFTIASGSATQSGTVTAVDLGPYFPYLSRTGAGTLTLAGSNVIPSVSAQDGTTILTSPDTSTFSYLNIDKVGDAGITPVMKIAGSHLSVYNFDLGNYSTGELQITNGGSFEFQNSATIGMDSPAYGGTLGEGRLLVSGAGSVLYATGDYQMVLGLAGQGSLTLSDGGMITTSNPYRIIQMGQQYTGRGVLNIGAASGATAVAPGIYNMNQVGTGTGTGEIVFNHTANDYVFTQDSTATGTTIWIHDAVSFRVENGTTTLRDINTNTGDTTVTGGKLILSEVAAPYSVIGTGKLNVGVNGTVGGVGAVKGEATIAGTLAPGNPAGILAFESGLKLEPTAKLTIDIGGYLRGIDFAGIDVEGLLELDGILYVGFSNDFLPLVGDSFDLFGGDYMRTGDFASSVVFLNGYQGTFDANTGTLTVTAVPEPSSLALLLIGGIAACFCFRKRCS